MINNDFNIKGNENAVEVIDTHKYLGVIALDQKLKMDHHLNYLCKNISKKIAMMYSHISTSQEHCLYTGPTLGRGERGNRAPPASTKWKGFK